MIAIIEGCGNNVASLQFALERIGVTSQLTKDAAVIKKASHVILPGVGHAESAMHRLYEFKLVEVLRALTQPVLGICLGMQLLYEFSAENDVNCLGIIPGKVHRLSATNQQSIPHMGWNLLEFSTEKKQTLKPYVYFVHSYAAPLSEHTVAVTTHTETFTAMVRYKNFIGMQFHPERSGKIGEALLKEFIENANYSSN